MDEKTRSLFLQVAGFLTMFDRGIIPVPEHAKKEAGELLEKIGAHMNENGG